MVFMVIKKKPYLVKIFNVEDLLQYFDGPEDLCAAYLDFILPRVSKSFPILTPAPTPDRNSKPAVTDLDFNLAYQNDWKVGSCREIETLSLLIIELCTNLKSERQRRS